MLKTIVHMNKRGSNSSALNCFLICHIIIMKLFVNVFQYICKKNEPTGRSCLFLFGILLMSCPSLVFYKAKNWTQILMVLPSSTAFVISFVYLDMTRKGTHVDTKGIRAGKVIVFRHHILIGFWIENNINNVKSFFSL